MAPRSIWLFKSPSSIDSDYLRRLASHRPARDMALSTVDGISQDIGQQAAESADRSKTRRPQKGSIVHFGKHRAALE